jgi:trimeric autotransporter adhesin
MMRMSFFLFVLGVVGLVVGCGDNLRPPDRTIESIQLTPMNASVVAGVRVQLTATATYNDGETEDVTPRATWTSSDPATATINVDGTAGLARGAKQGNALISATVDGVTGSTGLVVTERQLVSLDVTPVAPSLAKGTSVQLEATALYSDDSTEDVTAEATWSSAAASVATVTTTGTRGVVTGVAVGSATITAVLDGVSDSVTVGVTAATLSTIEVTPAAETIALGTTQQFAATGIFSDGTRQTMTTDVSWSSTASAATISNDPGSEGLATAAVVGTTTITATHVASSLSGSTSLEVTGAVLTAIEIEPLDPAMPAGTTEPFTATGIYSDSSTQDITSSVDWSTSDADVAAVTASGVVTAGNTGTATITATDPATSVSGASIVTVTPAELTAIQILPSAPNVAKGTSLQFTAEGIYSDLSTRVLTDDVTWQSGSPTIASISNGTTSRGFAVALDIGSTTITATDPATGIVGSTTLTVSAATLVRIDVDPANLTLPRGSSELYTATGVYTDFTTQDLTASVTWSSSNTTAATISNAVGSEGLATTLAAGTTTITALDPATGISGTARLIVGTSVLQGLTIEPSDPTIAKNGRIQFSCIGAYDDGTSRDITQFVTWSSSTAGVASISNAPKKRGLAQGKNPGTSTIACTDPGTGLSASTTLTVTGATLESITISPEDETIPNRTRVYFQAVGHYSDGSTADFTSSVAWSSSAPGVATISNQTFQWGTASAVGVGTTTISAVDGASGISVSTTLTVSDATLVSLAITPASPNVIVNTQTQLVATGTFSDGSMRDVTRDVTWTSSSTAVATVLNIGATKGTVTGVAVGQSTITANYPLTITSAMTTVTVIP